MTRWARTKFEELKAPRQPLVGAIDSYIIGHEKLSEEYQEMKRKQVSIPDEVLESLKIRQRPYQTIAGVIQELLELAEKVEKAQEKTIDLTSKASQQ